MLQSPAPHPGSGGTYARGGGACVGGRCRHGTSHTGLDCRLEIIHAGCMHPPPYPAATAAAAANNNNGCSCCKDESIHRNSDINSTFVSTFERN